MSLLRDGLQMRKILRPLPLYSPNLLEGASRSRNSLGTRFHARPGIKHVGFRAFRNRFGLATSSTPPFSTRWNVLGTYAKEGSERGGPGPDGLVLCAVTLMGNTGDCILFTAATSCGCQLATDRGYAAKMG
jgi:hypothetical protein